MTALDRQMIASIFDTIIPMVYDLKRNTSDLSVEERRSLDDYEINLKGLLDKFKEQ